MKQAYVLKDDINTPIISSRKIENANNNIERHILLSSIIKKDCRNEPHINVEALKNLWFPQKTYDVFISHSHSDISKVKTLEKFLLDTYGVSCSIDFNVWGDYRELSNLLIKQFKNEDFDLTCIQENIIMFLSTSLMYAINNSEYVFFLDTNNFINKDGITNSPWIYNEIELSKILSKYLKPEIVCEHCKLASKKLKFDFKTELERFPKISYGKFIQYIDLINALKDKTERKKLFFKLLSENRFNDAD